MSIILAQNAYGAMLIGVIFAAMFYGMMNIQAYLYYTIYQNDRLANKILASVIWLLGTLHVAMVSVTSYDSLVTNHDNQLMRPARPWFLFVPAALSMVLVSIAQVFFALRIFRLCRNKYRWLVTATILLLVVGHISFGFVTLAFFIAKDDIYRETQTLFLGVIPFFLCSALADVIITTALCVLLSGMRTSFSRMNAIISSLIHYAIHRCFLLTVASILEVVMFVVAPKSDWFLVMDICVAGLSANSLLASLNSRKFLHENAGPSNPVNCETKLSNLAFRTGSAQPSKTSAHLSFSP